MSHDQGLAEMAIRAHRIEELQEKLETYGYLSEEFWTDFDELKVLLLDTIQMAHQLDLEETASRYKEVFDELMDSVSSGYWK